MTREINTIRGKVQVSDLGETLIHEHLGDSGDWCLRMSVPEWIEKEELLAWRVRTAGYARDVGIKTIVDCSVMNLGRDVELMKGICDRSEINIIAATGFYYPDMLWMYSASDDSIFRIIMNDIEKGMDGTNVRAGIIKCATGEDGPTPTNERILRISARAHKESGLPILTHSSSKNRIGIIQQEIFESEGVDLNTVMIGHVGDTNDIDYIEAILSKGSYIGLDRFGQDDFNSLNDRCTTLATLVKRGWIQKIMISHDYPLYMAEGFWKDVPDSFREKSARMIQYIHKTVIPELRMRNITDEDLQTILVENPRRFFEGKSQ